MQANGTPGVQKVSVKHTEIMNFMLANPIIKLADVARHFGITQPWLSCIIHSEAFQAELATKQDQIFSGTVLPIKEKMMGIAHQALDQIADRMPLMKDETVANVADSVLDRLGFGSKAPVGGPVVPGTVVQVNVNLRQELEEARKLIGARSAVSPVLPALEVMVDGEPAPLGIGGPSQVQESYLSPASLSGPELPLAPAPSPGSGVPTGNQV